MAALSSLFPTNYKSMIKINGQSILPPLMTPQVRADCRQWREIAVQKERQRVAKTSSGSRSTVEANAVTKSLHTRWDTAIAEEPASDGVSSDENVKEEVPEESERTDLPSTSSTLIRSESFTIETPSAALADRIARLDEPPSPVNSRQLSVSLATTALSASPVIPDPRLSRLFSDATPRQLFPTVGDPNATLEQVEDMKKILASYHELQLEELRLRQEEEARRLQIQEESLRNLVLHSSAEESTIEKHQDENNSEADDAASSTAPVTPLPYDMPVFPDRLAACVKGFFTRQLYRSKHVQQLRKTAKDLVEQLDENPNPMEPASDNFQYMLKNQLLAVRCAAHEVFFLRSFVQQTSLSRENCATPKARLTKRLSLATLKYRARHQSASDVSVSRHPTTPWRSAKSPFKFSVAKSNKSHRRSMAATASPRKSLSRRTNTSTIDRTFTVSSRPRSSSSLPALVRNQLCSASSGRTSNSTNQPLKRPWR